MPELEAANARLKAGKLRCSIQLRGRVYTLVATLPTRDGTGHKQQRIPLPEVDLFEAERRAVVLGEQLRSDNFTWEAWDTPQGPATITVADFLEAAKALHASKYKKDPERGNNAWSKKWAPALRKLPPSVSSTPASKPVATGAASSSARRR